MGFGGDAAYLFTHRGQHKFTGRVENATYITNLKCFALQL